MYIDDIHIGILHVQDAYAQNLFEEKVKGFNNVYFYVRNLLHTKQYFLSVILKKLFYWWL